MANTLFDTGEYIIDKAETLKQRHNVELRRLQEKLDDANRDAENAFTPTPTDVTIGREEAKGLYVRAMSAQKNLLRYVHEHDDLTGAYNRSGFGSALAGLARAAVSERAEGMEQAGQSILLFFVDANDFKALNDAHGHDIGDQGLVNLAQEIYAHMRHNTSAGPRSDDRPEDVIARLGGDEFVVAAITDTEKIESVRSLLEERLRRVAFRQGNEEYTLGASVGHAAIPLQEVESVEQLQALMKTADASMYEAKGSEKDRKRQEVLSSAASAIVEAIKDEF